MENLPQPVQRVLGAPLPLRKLAAKGAAPGLRPADSLLVLAALTAAAEDELASTARATLTTPPAPLIDAAFAGPIDPRALAGLAEHCKDEGVLARVVRHESVSIEVLTQLAATGSEALSELIATNETRLLEHPELIEVLYKNPRTRMSTADRIVELAIRNGKELEGIKAFREIVQALQGELIAEASEEPTPDDEAFSECAALAIEQVPEGDLYETDEQTGEEHLREGYTEQKIAFDKLTVSGRIRRAQLGKTSDRSQAFRDPSPLVRKAAAKSDLLSESEVLQVTANRSTADDVLRLLGSDREWTRRHQVKVNLVMNPRTPYDIAARFVAYLRDHELRQVANSKDVPGAIVSQAKQQIQRKSK